VSEILDRDLSRSGRGMRLRLGCFAMTTMMATGQRKDGEEEKDAATHSLFCKRRMSCRDWHTRSTPSTPRSPDFAPLPETQGGPGRPDFAEGTSESFGGARLPNVLTPLAGPRMTRYRT
jgi:hypothetical protein